MPKHATPARFREEDRPAQAERLARPPEAAAGLWRDANRSDLRLLRRAIREDWPISPARRLTLMDEIHDVFLAARAADDVRLVIAVAWVVVDVANYNLRLMEAERRAGHGYYPEECTVLEAGHWARSAGLVGTAATEGTADVSYTIGRERIAYRVRLVAVPDGAAGPRWHFVCPLAVHGAACNRRVPEVYLPPGARYFGCPDCHQMRGTPGRP
jgi:hypothetical protein